MVKFYYDSNTKKVINYIETTFEVAMADEIPPQPAQAVGKTNVDYYNPDTGKIEWRQEDRPLTVEEKLSLVENKTESALKGIAELYESGV